MAGSTPDQLRAALAAGDQAAFAELYDRLGARLYRAAARLAASPADADDAATSIYDVSSPSTWALAQVYLAIS
jgi:hypothetical protein